MDTFHAHLTIDVVRDLLADKEAMEAVPAPEKNHSGAEEDLRQGAERDQTHSEEEQRRRLLDQRKIQENRRRVEAEEQSLRAEQRPEDVRRERRGNETSTRSGFRGLFRSRSRSRSRSRNHMENAQIYSREQWHARDFKINA